MHPSSGATLHLATTVTDRRSRIVTIIVLLALAAGIVLQRWPFRHGPFESDVCAYAVIGHEMRAGRKLYSDLWDHKPPLHYATYAAAEMLVGYGDWEIFLVNV